MTTEGNINDRTAFHEHFAGRGGWFDYNNFFDVGGMCESSLSTWRSNISEYRENGPGFRNAIVDFIDNGDLNAVASKSNTDYFIGVYAGTFFLINDLFLRMLASPDVLKGVGDISKEIPTQKIFNPQLTSFRQMIFSKPEPERICPVDKTRIFFAAQYAKTAMRFLVDHEYAHINFGHVDYKANVHSVFSIEELPDAKSSICSLDEQTMEMDADAFAAHHGILDTMIYSKNINVFSEEKRPFFAEWKNAVFNWLFAVYTTFRIFGFKTYDKTNLSQYSHPPVGVRQRLIFFALGQLCVERLKLGTVEEVTEIYHDVIEAVESAFNVISETPLNRDAIDFAYSPEGETHMRLICQNWNKVRPLLEKYTDAYLPPLQTA